MNKCINKNTRFYKILKMKGLSSDEVAQVGDKIEQESFWNWYGKGNIDSFGYPELINDLYIVNDKGSKITIFDLLNSDTYEKASESSRDLTYLDKIKRFLVDNKIAITKRISAFHGSEYAKTLESLLSELNRLDDNDLVTALTLHTEYILDTVSKFERRLSEFDNVNIEKLTPLQKKERLAKYKEFIVQASSFLETFDKVKLLEKPVVSNVNVNDILSKLEKVENKVTDIKNRINADREFLIRETFKNILSNPEIVNGVVDFLSAQADESGTQLLLDAIADSHHPLLQSVGKFYQRNMFERDEEVSLKTQQWRKFVKKHGNDFTKYLEKIDGKPTGRLIDKYDSKFNEKLFEYVNKLRELDQQGKKNTIEYYKVLSDYFEWKKDNMEQKYVASYYEAMNNLIPEARAARQEIQDKKDIIISKGVSNLTSDDYEALKILEEEMKWLRSSVNKDGTKKTGIELEISNSLFKYGQELSSFYESKGYNMRAFDRALLEAEEKGEEAKREFLENNTKEIYTKEFWDEFQSIISQSDNVNKEINDEIKKLLVGYRDSNGEVKIDEIPRDIIDKVTSLYEERSPSDMEDELRNRFNELVAFVPTEQYKNALEAKTKELESSKITQQEFDEWYHSTHDKIVDSFGTVSYKIKKIWTKMIPKNSKHFANVPIGIWEVTDIKTQYLNPKYSEDYFGYPLPKDKWISKEYKNLSDSDQQSLEYIKEFLADLVRHSKDNIIKRGYIPAVPKDDRKLLEILTNKKVAKEDNSDIAVTEAGEIVKFIPFKYIKRLNQLELPKVTDDMSDEEKKKIELERERIIKENKLSHGSSINYNLEEVMESFIKSALNNKYKSLMEVDLKLVSEQFKHLDIKVQNAQGDQLFDKIKGRVSNKKVEHTINATGSNTEKHFNRWMDMVFYEEFELDEGNLKSITGAIQDFSSLRAMGFNVLSGLNNKIVGNINILLEVAGGQYYKRKEYLQARKRYFLNQMSFIANHNKKETNNLLDGFIKKMDILQSQDELSLKEGGPIQTVLHKARMLKNSAYFFQHVGEHQVQNTTLIAMSLSHRIVNGKILSFEQFINESKFPINKEMSKEEANKNIQLNKELRRSKELEFESFPTVLDSYELVNGYIKLKDNIKISNEELSDFKNKVIGVNQKLHGIYNKEDAGTIQRYALGRLAIQFRKWIRPSWNRRFGPKFGQSNWNERRQEYDEGMYITTSRFVFNPLIRTFKQWRTNQETTASEALKNIIDGYKDLIFNSKINWHILSETEKANIRRTGLEMIFLATVIALGFALKRIKGEDDDDDKVKDKILTWALYQSDRLFGEISTFTPFGIVREGNRLFKSPSPVFNTLEDAGKLMTALIAYPFRTDEEREFKSGIYHGQDRVKIYFNDMLPVINQIQRLSNLSENNQRYNIFR